MSWPTLELGWLYTLGAEVAKFGAGVAKFGSGAGVATFEGIVATFRYVLARLGVNVTKIWR